MTPKPVHQVSTALPNFLQGHSLTASPCSGGRASGLSSGLGGPGTGSVCPGGRWVGGPASPSDSMKPTARLCSCLSNKSHTLPLATQYNVKCVGLSPDGRLAIIVDEGKTLSRR